MSSKLRIRVRPRLGAALSIVGLCIALVTAACAEPVVQAGPVPLDQTPSPTAAPTATLTPTPSPTPKPTVSPTKRPTVKPKPTLRTTTAPPPTTKPPTPTSTKPPGVDVWSLASGGTGVVGSGTKGLIQYRVEVEKATSLSAATVAAVVDSTLAHVRGWTNEGWTFQRVTLAAAEVDMVLRVATPATVDRICAIYGLNTGGQVSCRGGKYVMLNLTRWNIGVPDYSDAVGQYRILLVNHEVGHLLKHSTHPPCPGAGRPQPVMMQVYYGGLQGCDRNVWPYADDGTLIG